MLKELFLDHQKNINYFFQHVDVTIAESILTLFCNCKGMLVFTGVGKSGIIAEKLAMSMISTGTKALYIPPTNALHGDIGILSEDDIMIFISKSGESEELLSLVPFVKQKKAKTVAWVSSEKSSLLKICDIGINLPFEKELCPFDLAPTTSTAVQLIFGDVLSVALMKMKKFSLDEYALNHPAGSIGKKLMLKVEDLMLKGEELPICQGDTPLCDVLVELSNKRCGCLIIVDKNYKTKGIFTDGDLRRALQKGASLVLEKKMEELMNSSFISTHRKQLAWNALSLMQKDEKKWITVMPVLEENKLVGLIRMHDIVQAGIS